MVQYICFQDSVIRVIEPGAWSVETWEGTEYVSNRASRRIDAHMLQWMRYLLSGHVININYTHEQSIESVKIWPGIVWSMGHI